MGIGTRVQDIAPALRKVLRAPDLEPLFECDQGFRTEDGRVFPTRDGVLCLLPEEQRGADLGDGRFYDAYPFGDRDWSQPHCVGRDVEKELKTLLATLPRRALIADIGCGAGRISTFLSQCGYENVASLDFSLPSLRRVRNHSKNLCLWANALAIPIATTSMDLVISSGVVHHTANPLRAIAECARVVRPGGRLYLRVYNRRSIYFHAHRLFGRLHKVACALRCGRLFADAGFVTYRGVRRHLLKRDDPGTSILQGRYGNLFLKPLVRFLEQDEVEDLLFAHGFHIEQAERQGFTHRMHCYVARKLT